jgi:competence protein ComEC
LFFDAKYLWWNRNLAIWSPKETSDAAHQERCLRFWKTGSTANATNYPYGCPLVSDSASHSGSFLAVLLGQDWQCHVLPFCFSAIWHYPIAGCGSWPEAMSGPSFQLSFAAVATIVIMHDLPVVRRLTERRDENLSRKAARAVGSLILTGVAIELVLTPIALFHFHKAGLYGALANVVAIPMTTFMIMPLEALALIFDVMGLGQPFWWLAGQGIAAILILAHCVSSLPGAVTMMPAMPVWAFAAFVVGALIFGLLTTAVRYFGVPLCAIGIVVMVTAPRPDILVTWDGKHLAIVSADGEVALLRGRAGEFVRGMISEKAGSFAKATPIEDWPGVQCTLDNCVIIVMGAERAWTLLATRTKNPIPSMEMAAACKRADIVVSERWLPLSCRPKWIKADRRLLEQSGGLAFYLDDQRVVTANEGSRHMPWVKAAHAARAAEASDQ